MTEQFDFLVPTYAQIRHQLKNILESYNHDWDLIAELVQNSVDAIHLAQPVKGHMRLEIDAPNKRISLEDNGCGISPSELPGLLAPFSSDKIGDPTLIGQKGVGISFVMFSSSDFELKTCHSEGSARASISGANAWLDTESNETPKLNVELSETSSECGTKVTITLPMTKTLDFFGRTMEQLEMILRTRTAIGDTRTIWGEESVPEPDKDVHIKFVDLNNETYERVINCSYFLPISKLSKTSYISLRDFQDWNARGDWSDAQKRKKIGDKVIFLNGEKDKGGKRIRYWSCFVPTRQTWNTISVNSKLIDKQILDMNPTDRMEELGNAEYLFSGGMYTSTRNMPTGIRSEMRAKGWAGYLPNFFIIVDDPQLSFDIGRKSIPSRTLGMLRDVAADVFRDFINSVNRYLGGEPDVNPGAWDRSAIFNKIRDLPNLESDKTKFLKRPSNQEATIAAIFFELLGSGKLENFQPYISGYRNKYDLYAKYKQSDVVLEFKYKLSSLFSDFDIERKLFDQVDIVVVWELEEDDRKVAKNRGLDLEPISQGLTRGRDSIFHFELTLGPVMPIKIICLKRLVEGD